jgi:IS30 family transposase
MRKDKKTHKFTDDDKEVLKLLYERNASHNEMSEYFGVNPSTIFRQAESLGIKRTKFAKPKKLSLKEILEEEEKNKKKSETSNDASKEIVNFMITLLNLHGYDVIKRD